MKGSIASKSFPLLPIITALFLLSAAGSLFGISASIQSTTGKVEIKRPGEGWIAANQGMNIDSGATISTGFNSKAIIMIGESVLEVKALTRMELEELVEQEGVIDTKLHLKVGKVKADVRSTEGLRNNFRLRSPVSTAAVRGTLFQYDGYTLWVEEGTVVMGNSIGQSRSVFQGEESDTDGYTPPASGEETIAQQFEVSTSTSEEGGTVQVEQTDNEYSLLIIDLNW